MITSDLLSTLVVPRWRSRLALRRLERKGWIKLAGERVSLSEQGLSMAQNVVRSHRLWEHYLAAEVGMPEILIHGGAERLEHYTDRQLRERLNKESNAPTTDPHGKSIPPEA